MPETENITKDNSEDFDVTFKVSEMESDNTVIVTSTEDTEKVQRILSAALNSYDPENNLYSALLKDIFPSVGELTTERIDELAENTQNSLSKILAINSIIKKEINKDDIVGKTVEAIDSNINTSIKLSYPNPEGKNKLKELERVKDKIKNFNLMINLDDLVRTSVTTTYTEGTFICYLRNSGDRYVIDYYPLGVCELGEYEINKERIVLFNISELRSRLQKVYKKTRKNKALFFSEMAEEVKNNYPTEVYKAFINKEKYAILNPKRTGVMKINHLNRTYGLSPIFRALDSILMLNTFDNSDKVNSKAKAKKIIHQKLRSEVGGSDHSKKGFDEMAYAHENFMKAWKMPTVVVTTPWFVDEIKYVEPTIELTDVKTVNNYRSRVMSTLGIGFLMNSDNQSVSTASISVDQLLKVINSITSQLERILLRFYGEFLKEQGHGLNFCPTVKVVDAEQLDFNLRKELSTSLYTLFNCSLETSLGILGVDIQDEIAKRQSENDQKLDEVFFPRNTAYTASGSNGNVHGQTEGGRPADSTNEAKQGYDKARQQTLNN